MNLLKARSRRYYSLTPIGSRHLEEIIDEWIVFESLWTGYWRRAQMNDYLNKVVGYLQIPEDVVLI